MPSLKITGSMKGADERDLIFGKLFGYLSVIRSGRISGNKSTVCIEKALGTLLDLLYGKPWLKEAAIEGILTLLNAVTIDEFRSVISSRLSKLFQDLTVTELNADHLTLLLGIAYYTHRQGSKLPEYVKTFLGQISEDTLAPEDEDVPADASLADLARSLMAAPGMRPVFIASCAGYPKVR